MEKVNEKQTNYNDGKFGGNLKDGTPGSPSEGSVVKAWVGNNVLGVFAAIVTKAGKNDFNGKPETPNDSEVADSIVIIINNKIDPVKADISDIKNIINNNLFNKNSEDQEIVNSPVAFKGELTTENNAKLSGTTIFPSGSQVTIEEGSNCTFKVIPKYLNNDPFVTQGTMQQQYLSLTGGNIHGSLGIDNNLTVKENFTLTNQTIDYDMSHDTPEQRRRNLERFGTVRKVNGVLDNLKVGDIVGAKTSVANYRGVYPTIGYYSKCLGNEQSNTSGTDRIYFLHTYTDKFYRDDDVFLIIGKDLGRYIGKARELFEVFQD